MANAAGAALVKSIYNAMNAETEAMQSKINIWRNLVALVSFSLSDWNIKNVIINVI